MLIVRRTGINGAPAWHVAALTLLMAIWWMTEALPLTVTALLPFLALPLMGVMTAQEVAKEYYSPILFLMLGGAFVALAIERIGLHRRVALAILERSGNSAEGLMIGLHDRHGVAVDVDFQHLNRADHDADCTRGDCGGRHQGR